MYRHGANEQRGTADWRAFDDAMTTFTLRLPRWPVLVRLCGRNPLVRATDRLEALALILAMVVSLVSVPIALAVGTAVHDVRSDLYAQQANSRSAVAATITEVPTASDTPQTIIVPVRWSVDGAEHRATVAAPSTAKVGDRVDIWVDDTGEPVAEPATTAHAAVEAASVAVGILAGMAGTAVLLFLSVRAVCNRIRYAQWQRGLDSLVGHGGSSQRA